MRTLVHRIFGVIVFTFITNTNLAYLKAEDKGKELYQAVQFQDLPTIQKLLSQGAPANFRENGRPLLCWAAQAGNVEVVNALIKGGANPNLADDGSPGHTPLMRAIETQQTEVVKALLKAKADPNALTKDGESSLMMAVESRKPQIVQALLDSGADPKWVSEKGDSAVLTAAQDGMDESLEIIKILGKAKANLNASNDAYTPLVYALEQSNVKLTQTLLDAGADPNVATKGGKLPIEAALDNPELLSILLKAKADPNKPLSDKSTVLLKAIQNNQVEPVKLLLEAGANAKQTDSNGDTPLVIADRNAQTEIAALLRQKLGTGTSAATNPNCTIADAAKKQMELHGLLQAQVNAGKMSSDIFRTFNEDTKDYGKMLTEDPPAACQLFERLKEKYGV